MIPILYDSVNVGVIPTSYGVGALSDCLGCTVTEKKGGFYELSMDYAATGIHAEALTVGAIIKAKANYNDDAQLFRIYKVGKTINGRFTVSARHISYDLSGYVITSGSANNVGAACALLQTNASGWTISTNKSTAASFRITEPSSVRSWFGGKAGSLLDAYGGEWHFDNFTCRLLSARGADRGVTIRYGKNLTELSQEINIENLATSVQGYYKDPQTDAVTLGTKMPTGLVLGYPRDVVVDFSSYIDTESGTAIATQLNALTTKYITNNVLTRAVSSITLKFAQLGTGSDRVELGDTVKIYYEALGITATSRCIATTWDTLRDRYTSASFGDARTDITDTIKQVEKEATQAVTSDFMVNAINNATSLITGNKGGYVILHDSDGDGEPDEILIMNTPDIATATKVWRWNKNGLGYSSTGYAGSYGTAITADGQIVADYVATGNLNASLITTGTLNADLIKAGTISDAAGNSSINMTNGAATMLNFKAKTGFYLVDSNGTTRNYLSYNSVGGTSFGQYNQNGTINAVISSATSDGGQLRLYDNAGEQAINADGQNGNINLYKTGAGLYIYNAASQGKLCLSAYCSSVGGYLITRQSNGTDSAYFGTGSSNAGTFGVRNSSGTTTIYGVGSSGALVCVSLTQTSSRKVKDNIKPIEDARKLLELDAVSFDYKDKAQGTNKRGFIAEDVAEVLPNLVTPETDETPATLDYIGMIPYLQAIIKEQDERIKALEDKINKLEG